MNAITATDPYHGTSYHRVPKNVARRLYGTGTTILMQAVNMRPFSMWQSPYKADRFSHNNEAFDAIVNEYEYYNTCSERGYYAAYYVADDDNS